MKDNSSKCSIANEPLEAIADHDDGGSAMQIGSSGDGSLFARIKFARRAMNGKIARAKDEKNSIALSSELISLIELVPTRFQSPLRCVNRSDIQQHTCPLAS